MQHRRAMHIFVSTPGRQTDRYVSFLEDDEDPQANLPDDAYAYQEFYIFFEEKDFDDIPDDIAHDIELDTGGNDIMLTSPPLSMTKMKFPGGQVMTVEEISNKEGQEKLAKLLKESGSEEIVLNRHGGVIEYIDERHETVEDRTDQFDNQGDLELDEETYEQFDGLV